MITSGRCTQCMIVSEEALAQAPEDFRDYVKKHFKRTSVLGQKCWAAILHDRNSDMNWNYAQRGDAPHPSDERRYHEVEWRGSHEYTLRDWANSQEGKSVWLVTGSYSEFPTRHAPSGEDWDDQ